MGRQNFDGVFSLYGIFVVALVPGVMVNYFIEFNKIRYNESLVLLMDQLEHLDTLSKEELREFSAKVRNFRRKYKNRAFLLRNALVFICGQFFSLKIRVLLAI